MPLSMSYHQAFCITGRLSGENTGLLELPLFWYFIDMFVLTHPMFNFGWYYSLAPNKWQTITEAMLTEAFDTIGWH